MAAGSECVVLAQLDIGLYNAMQNVAWVAKAHHALGYIFMQFIQPTFISSVAGADDTRVANGKAAAYAMGLLEKNIAIAKVAAVSVLRTPLLRLHSTPAPAGGPASDSVADLCVMPLSADRRALHSCWELASFF